MKITSLCYHDVTGLAGVEASGFRGAAMSTYKLDAATFHLHLTALSRSPHVRAASARDLGSGVPGSGIPCLLTFDDGGVSAHDVIAPMLEKFGWTGHFFIITGRIGEPGFLSAEQIRSLRRRGHVIGTHSASHRGRMSSWTSDRLEAEWASSARALSSLLDEPVQTASVPSGFYSRRVAEAASRAGIRMLFTLEPSVSVRGVDECAVIGRFLMRRGTAAPAAARLAAGNPAARLEQWLLWKLKQTAKSSLRGGYSRARETWLSWQAP